MLRFATFDLVRGEWRRYNFDLTTPGEYIPIDEEDATIFDVSAVNIEENGNQITSKLRSSSRHRTRD